MYLLILTVSISKHKKATVQGCKTQHLYTVYPTNL